MAVSLSSIGVFELLVYLTIAVINSVCAYQLVRHYLKMRAKITWLFITLFAVMAVCFFVNFLIGTDILYLNVRTALTYTFLIVATIIAVIGSVMLGVKQLYALPLFVAAIALFHQISLNSNYTTTVNSIQAYSYALTGQIIGEPWYITLKSIFPNFILLGQQTSTILNLLFDPLAISTPSVLGLYLAAITIPTTALFYILAWKNRSGRSLGFALGLTTYILVGFLTASTVPRDLMNTLILIGALFYALGILGAFDGLMKKEAKKEQIKKQKSKTT
nr:hypothetical protein [Candidatus Freyarchaeota archaeon]